MNWTKWYNGNSSEIRILDVVCCYDYLAHRSARGFANAGRWQAVFFLSIRELEYENNCHLNSSSPGARQKPNAENHSLSAGTYPSGLWVVIRIKFPIRRSGPARSERRPDSTAAAAPTTSTTTITAATTSTTTTTATAKLHLHKVCLKNGFGRR